MPDAPLSTFILEDPGLYFVNKAGSSPSSSPSSRRSEYASRRPHKKSRGGCDICKIRHLKCDEHHPACGRCIRDNRSCRYAATRHPRPGASLMVEASRQTLAAILDASLAAELGSSTALPRTVDPLELFHHFVCTTEHAWIGSPRCQQILQQHGPGLAWRAPYFLYAILSFSSYHMAATRPRTRKYRLAGDLLYDNTLKSYSVVLRDGLDSADADAMLACCILLCMIAFRNLAVEADGQDTVRNKSPARNIIGLRSIYGFQVLQQAPALQSKLGKSIWTPVMGECRGDRHSSTDPIAQFSEIFHSMDRSTEPCSPQKLTAPVSCPYEAALGSLRRLLRCEVGDGMIGAFFCFSSVLDAQFRSLLEKEEPKALLLLLFWYATGTQIDQWWILSSARGEALRLLEFLQRTPDPTIQALLKFPAEKLDCAINEGR